jgi:Fe-S-cluster containining protein
MTDKNQTSQYPSPIYDAQSDPEWHEIETLKNNYQIEALGQKANQLIQLPQSLCKIRGNCCRVATFKNGLSAEEIQVLAASDQSDAQNARDFLSIFVPYTSLAEVEALAPGFVDRARAAMERPEGIGYFGCKYVGSQGECQVHEDRPTGCRFYPFPHEKMVFHPGCGFEAHSIANAQKLKSILSYFDSLQSDFAAQKKAIEEQQDLARQLIEQVNEKTQAE